MAAPILSASELLLVIFFCWQNAAIEGASLLPNGVSGNGVSDSPLSGVGLDSITLKFATTSELDTR